MKLFTLPVCFLLFLGSMFSQIPEEGLVAFFDLEMGFPIDSSPNSNHGVITGSISPGEDRFGNPTGAGYFNGQQNYFDVPSEELELTQAISISLWIKVESHDVGSWVGLVNKWGVSSNGVFLGGYYLGITREGKIRWNTTAVETDGTTVPVGEWVHYVVSYNSEETFNVYQNGLLLIETPAAGLMPPMDAAFRVGQQSEINPDLGNFNGFMDQILIYDRALTISEVQQLFQYEPEPVVSALTDISNNPDDILFSLYPNPTTDILYFNELTVDQFSTGYLLNNSGQKLQYIQHGQTQILTSGLPVGMYFIQLRYKDQVETVPFIKR